MPTSLGGSFVAGFDTTPVATSAATRTPASPSPATSPEAASTPVSTLPAAGAGRLRSASARTQPPT
jgi:hypothetical protein